MNLKIVNVSKFVRSIFIILGISICVALFLSNTSFSHKDTQYKVVYVSNGDTLWSIAKDERNSNAFYENKDIRDIIDSIKSLNKLSNSNLSINQKLVIPYI